MIKLSAKAKGELAEARFTAEALSQGYAVSIPFGDNLPYDRILDVNGTLYKVQIKSTTVMDVSNRSNGYKFLCAGGNDVKKSYSSNEVDLFALYIHPLDLWYIIPIDVMESITVRLYPHKTGAGRYERYKNRWKILFEN